MSSLYLVLIISIAFLRLLLLLTGTFLSTVWSSRPLFAAWSALSLPMIPVCDGIQLIVGVCVILFATFLIALVMGLVSILLFLRVCTAVNESVCMIDFFLCLAAFKSAISMAIISASSTDAESLVW